MNEQMIRPNSVGFSMFTHVIGEPSLCLLAAKQQDEIVHSSCTISKNQQKSSLHTFATTNPKKFTSKINNKQLTICFSIDCNISDSTFSKIVLVLYFVLTRKMNNGCRWIA